MFCAEMCPAPHLPATRLASQPQWGLDRTLRSSWIKKCGGYDRICDSELNSPDTSAQEQFSQCHIIQRRRTFFDKRACTRWRLPGAACHSAEERISNSATSSQAAIFVPRGCASSPLKRCLLRQGTYALGSNPIRVFRRRSSPPAVQGPARAVAARRRAEDRPRCHEGAASPYGTAARTAAGRINGPRMRSTCAMSIATSGRRKGIKSAPDHEDEMLAHCKVKG